jgi:plasmid maintenance system antidote protein VapI
MLQTLLAKVHGSTQKKAAEELGVSSQFLNDVLRGRREISATLAKAMGYQRRTIFERIKGESVFQPRRGK